MTSGATGEDAPDPAVTSFRTEPLKHRIEIVEPTNRTVWTAGANETIVIRWGFDPDPIHSIRFELSVVGCCGDWDRIGYTIVPNRTSSAKNGQKEWINFTLDASTRTTQVASLRLLYSSPSMPGQNISPEFTILNPADPVTEINVAVVPERDWVYSGDSIYASAIAHIDSAPLWLSNFSLSVDIGTLSKPSCRTDLAGECRFQFFAPFVTQETYATISATATHPDFASNSSSARVKIIPIDPDPTFVTSQVDPPTILGGEKASIVVSVNNLSGPVVGAQVIPTITSGGITPTAAYTATAGSASFVYTAPAVDRESQESVRFDVLLSSGKVMNTSAQVLVKPGPSRLQVVWTSPAEGATGVLRDSAVKFAFNRPARPGETLGRVDFAPPVDQVTVTVDDTVVSAKPSNLMRSDTAYRVTVTWIEADPIDGHTTHRSFTVQFTTESPTSPPPPSKSPAYDTALGIGVSASAGMVIGLVVWLVWLRARKQRKITEERRSHPPGGTPPDARREAVRRAAARARSKK